MMHALNGQTAGEIFHSPGFQPSRDNSRVVYFLLILEPTWPSFSKQSNAEPTCAELK
jgi:hypothetical protein